MSMPARPNLDAQQDALKARLKKEIMRELVLELNLDKPTPAQRVRRFLTEEKRKWRRHPFSALARLLCRLAMLITMFCLLYLVGDVLVKGVPNLKPSLFAWKYTTDNVSMLPALINTVIIALTSLVVAIPLGVGGAIYLAEYARRDSRLVKLIRLTAETLQGIPSIVYGLFGMVFFTTLHCNYTLLAGALTLSLMVLPLILRTTEEALLSIPDSYREGSFGLGAGKLRTVFRIILPSAMPGILSGIILAIGRIVGESAALIFTSGSGKENLTFVGKNGFSLFAPLFQSTRTLSVHMYNLMSEGLYTKQAQATAVVLLVLVVGINALSSFLAKKLTKGNENG